MFRVGISRTWTNRGPAALQNTFLAAALNPCRPSLTSMRGRRSERQAARANRPVGPEPCLRGDASHDRMGPDAPSMTSNRYLAAPRTRKSISSTCHRCPASTRGAAEYPRIIIPE